MTQRTLNTTDLAIPPALAAQLRAAAEEPQRSTCDDALGGYLRSWATSAIHHPASQAAARLMHAGQGNPRLDDTPPPEPMTRGRA
jgi:hypothetical protein